MAITAQLTRIYNLAKDQAFVNRVAAALLDKVSAVAVEAGATADHANRLALAAKIATNPEMWADRMALGVIVGSSAIQGAITSDSPDTNNTSVTDAQITGIVNNDVFWNFYADTAGTI